MGPGKEARKMKMNRTPVLYSGSSSFILSLSVVMMMMVFCATSTGDGDGAFKEFVRAELSSRSEKEPFDRYVSLAIISQVTADDDHDTDSGHHRNIRATLSLVCPQSSLCLKN